MPSISKPRSWCTSPAALCPPSPCTPTPTSSGCRGTRTSLHMHKLYTDHKLWLTLTRGKRIEYLDIFFCFLMFVFVCFRYIVNCNKMIHFHEKGYLFLCFFAILDLFVRDNSCEIPPEKRLFLVINFEDPCYWKLKSSLQPDFFWNKLVAQNQI